MNIANLTGEELLTIAGIRRDRQYRRLYVGRSYLWVWMVQEKLPWVYVARVISPHPSRREGKLDWLVREFWRSYQGIGPSDLEVLGYQVTAYPGGWAVMKRGEVIAQGESIRASNPVMARAITAENERVAWEQAREHYERSV